jgi:hypothetical protein
MPANYTYRKTTETLVMERTNIIKQANTIAEAEVKIGAGCIEEVIVQVLFRLKFYNAYFKYRTMERLDQGHLHPLLEDPRQSTPAKS